MCFVDVCPGLRIGTTVVAQLMITSFSANILFVNYDHLSLFSCLCWFQLCKSQMHVHSSRLKIRSTGSLPTCICWKILKDKPKWMDKRKEIGTAKKTSNKKRKTMAISAPASVVPADAPAALAVAGDVSEPAGRPDEKKEKQKLRQQKLRQCLTMEAVDYLMAKKKEADLEKDLKKEERCNKAFALQEERLKLEREKFEFYRKLEEDKIIYMDLSTMTFDDQQYFEDRKREIRERRFNN